MLFSLLVLETLLWIDDLLGADQRRLSSSESIRDELGRSVRICDTLESAVFGADWRRVVARRRLRPSSSSFVVFVLRRDRHAVVIVVVIVVVVVVARRWRRGPLVWVLSAVPFGRARKRPQSAPGFKSAPTPPKSTFFLKNT